MMSTEELVELGLSPVAARLVLAEAECSRASTTQMGIRSTRVARHRLCDGYTDSEEETRTASISR